MKIFNRLTIALAFALILSSCGETKQNPIEIAPLNTSIDGDIGKYFEIVEGSYKMETYDNQGYLGYIVQIEVKRTDLDFDFGTDSLELYGPDGTRLYFDLTDDKGKPILEFDGYSSKLEDLEKLLASSKNSTTWISFYDTYGTDKEKVPNLPEGSIKFKSYSGLKFKVHYSSNSNTNTNNTINNENDNTIKDNSNVTVEDWDKILDSYEKFANDYIDYTKKIVELQKKGDNTSLTEVTKLMPKAMKLNQDAAALGEKLQNASNDLTPSQMTRYTKIMTKFAQAALELSNQ